MSWTDVVGTLVGGFGGPAATVAGLLSGPLPWEGCVFHKWKRSLVADVNVDVMILPALSY